MVTLKWLNLAENELSGSIPAEFGRLANLEFLFLGKNELTGPIPSELGELVSLERLNLAENNLSGSIPSELGNLASLAHLELSSNDLSGASPPELGSLTNLNTLYLNDNELTGPIPVEFGSLADLVELVLASNAAMSGPLPASLTNLRSLETFSTGGTMLCAPSDPDFIEWMQSIQNRYVALCEGETAYLVQAVQSREFPVPLVAGEEALLRVFVTATRPNNSPIPEVRASLYLDGALAHVADIGAKPGPIPTDVDEGSLSQSANYMIPGEVVRPGLEMVVEIDPGGTVDAGLGVAKRVPETGRIPVDVGEMPLFDLTVIPFLWNTDPDSVILEQTAGMAADPEGHDLLELLHILMPVEGLDVTAHEPVLSSSNNVHTLFAQTWAIRALEGGRGHYKGMMSGPVIGGAAGLAARPGRVSFSVPRASVIAHELGHNMSLWHGTCPGASGVDPGYPYRGGAIGAWGYDFRGGGRLVTPSSLDVMACGGSRSWISDYHFTKAHRFRLAGEGVSGPVSPATSLLLWGGVDPEGAPYLEPAFVVDAPATLPDSGGEYEVTGRAEGGRELFSLSFDIPEVTDGDGSSSFAFALPVQDAWAGALASITFAGPTGSVTLDRETNRPMAILRDPGTGQVRGILRDLPPVAVAAQAAAAAALSPEPGLDILISSGIPDAAAWSR